MSTIGDDPSQGKCGICRTSRALTGSGQLYTMAVRGPKNTYVQRICEDCVRLFNTTHWPRVRKLLHWMTRSLKDSAYWTTTIGRTEDP